MKKFGALFVVCLIFVFLIIVAMFGLSKAKHQSWYANLEGPFKGEKLKHVPLGQASASIAFKAGVVCESFNSGSDFLTLRKPVLDRKVSTQLKMCI
jgi:hypothetical protein